MVAGLLVSYFNGESGGSFAGDITFIFSRGVSSVVTARGGGKVHLLSYQCIVRILSVVGSITTTNLNEMRFIISHSYTYERYAFYWEGAGEAVFGASLERKPVGRSWSDARVAVWGTTGVTTGNASGLQRLTEHRSYLFHRSRKDLVTSGKL